MDGGVSLAAVVALAQAVYALAKQIGFNNKDCDQLGDLVARVVTVLDELQRQTAQAKLSPGLQTAVEVRGRLHALHPCMCTLHLC